MKTTVSVIKADVGSLPGHVCVHKDLIDIAKDSLEKAKKQKVLTDYCVTRCGDDLELIMTHSHGRNNKEVHKLAFETFEKAAARAKELKLYGAGQDLLSDAFSGNIRGMGPGVTEMEFEERKSDPVLIFMADKTDAGAFNLPLFKIFADPFTTSGLTIDPTMNDGFVFEVHDIKGHVKVEMSTPEEIYDLLSLIGTSSRYVIKHISKRSGEPAASLSTEKLNMLAGKYVGKDDPAAIVRCQSGFPSVGEVLEGFTFPHLVAGWMRGSHHGPFMPVSSKQSSPTRFDGPPRVVCYGFQLCNGALIGPIDMFDDPSFDLTRQKANEIAEYMRRHGPFEPHRLSPEELEYTSLPKVIAKLEKRFSKLE